jgi:diphthine-ammonia ligase
VKVVASWSGGKDSCFACFKAIQEGFDVSSLLTMMSSRGTSNFHAISSELLDAQADAIGIPVVKRMTTWNTYEQEFKNALNQMRTAGVGGLVTGDIYEVALHDEGWLDRVCGEAGVKPIKPLWHRDTQQIFNEFINEGFKAIVIRVKTDLLGVSWLGRQLNKDFLDDLLKLGTFDPCGERGEYHTFVTDGPLFNKRIEILGNKKTTHNGYGRLEIERFEVKSKGR